MNIRKLHSVSSAESAYPVDDEWMKPEQAPGRPGHGGAASSRLSRRHKDLKTFPFQNPGATRAAAKGPRTSEKA